MNVVFLDYDGVVNTPRWDKDENGKWHCRYNFPIDGKVNNEGAVQWISEFCEKYNYSIVVTSTWREWGNYQICLRNAGLRDNIEILGGVPVLRKKRHFEIEAYLEEHPEIENYLIFDDENTIYELRTHLVLCNCDEGFGLREYREAERLHRLFTKESLSKGTNND